MNVEGIGKAAAVHDVAFLFPPHRARLPARALGNRIDEIDRARVFQVAQAVFDGIDAGFRRKFVDIGFMRKGVRQC